MTEAAVSPAPMTRRRNPVGRDSDRRRAKRRYWKRIPPCSIVARKAPKTLTDNGTSGPTIAIELRTIIAIPDAKITRQASCRLA
jgi:hypothetical protein